MKARSFKPHVILPKKVKRPKDIFVSVNHGATKARLGENAGASEILPALAEEWNAMSKEEKGVYEKMVAKDQIRFNKQMDDLKHLGYFMRENGVKSRNHNEEEYEKKNYKKKIKQALGRKMPPRPKNSYV